MTHREAQTCPAREGKLDAIAQLVVSATLSRSTGGAEPGDPGGYSFIRLEGIWILGSTGDWRGGSMQ